MEKFTFCLRGGLAKRLERLSTSHGPGYLDYLLETHTPDADLPPPPPPRPVTDWAPKIGVDDLTKSIEIDVGSQVIVVNLSDFYKPRDAAQLFGTPTDDVANGAASGLDLLASTANMYRSRGGGGGSAGKKFGAPRFTCPLCQTSFIRRRDLDKHECDDDDPAAAGGRSAGGAAGEPRVPPLVVRPTKQQQPRRLEDSSSDEDGAAPRPPAPPRRLLPPPQAAKKRQDGKKEAYVCRVCQSKFRDPQSVLHHLKQFHLEHAMKAWSKFQENLRTRQPEAPAGRGRGRGGSSAAVHAARTADTFAVRSVSGAPMKLKLSRSQQQQQQELRRRQQQEEEGAEPEEYAVLPSEIPALRPGQRDPIYHQTQYRVYQPPDPMPLPRASPPLDTGPPPASTSPGYVTCGVCGGTKYYTYTEQCRMYGSFACEACRKFVARQPQTQPVQCQLGLGQCHIPVLVPRNSTDTRCRACWLKKSLLAFNMPQEKHDRFRECLPPSIRDTVPTFAVKPYKEMGVCERDTLE
ncbi:Histone-lysine N-methyltransferase trithorax [Amphibalanus amphitrite]|uniref:Histone-lysine N-methyltransferase trithorax n=1 Tax=Amphibalanus amphitrite TaxID=1232801 RepID=A0A6A4XDN0_AMPAM|nr:Histone-lysine N-methyltransferase trithorax [Amphibalanus amphitrite]